MAVNYVPRNSALQRLEPYDYAMYLFHKYVTATTSDLEINLPWKCRKKLKDFFQGDRLAITGQAEYARIMFELFDRAWTDIHKLILIDSYQRFKFTKEYEALWKLWNQTPRSGMNANHCAFNKTVRNHTDAQQSGSGAAMFQKTGSWNWLETGFTVTNTQRHIERIEDEEGDASANERHGNESGNIQNEKTQDGCNDIDNNQSDRNEKEDEMKEESKEESSFAPSMDESMTDTPTEGESMELQLNQLSSRSVISRSSVHQKTPRKERLGTEEIDEEIVVESNQVDE